MIRDEAFCFYYQDNLDLLRSYGAEIVEFSALWDQLPADLDGLYIGGGYPELLAAELSANRSLVVRFAGSPPRASIDRPTTDPFPSLGAGEGGVTFAAIRP